MSSMEAKILSNQKNASTIASPKRKCLAISIREVRFGIRVFLVIEPCPVMGMKIINGANIVAVPNNKAI